MTSTNVNKNINRNLNKDTKDKLVKIIYKNKKVDIVKSNYFIDVIMQIKVLKDFVFTYKYI